MGRGYHSTRLFSVYRRAPRVFITEKRYAPTHDIRQRVPVCEVLRIGAESPFGAFIATPNGVRTRRKPRSWHG